METTIKSQYVFVERNDWEGETWAVVVDLTEEEATLVQDLIYIADAWEEGLFKLFKQEVSDETISTIKNIFDGGYMEPISRAKLSIDVDNARELIQLKDKNAIKQLMNKMGIFDTEV